MSNPATPAETIEEARERARSLLTPLLGPGEASSYEVDEILDEVGDLLLERAALERAQDRIKERTSDTPSGKFRFDVALHRKGMEKALSIIEEEMTVE